MIKDDEFIIRRGELKKCLIKEKRIVIPDGVTRIDTDVLWAQGTFWKKSCFPIPLITSAKDLL